MNIKYNAKHIVSLLLFACFTLFLFSACSDEANVYTKDPDVSPMVPAESMPNPTTEPTPDASIASEPELTMDAIKQAARDAGYTVWDGQDTFDMIQSHTPYNNLIDACIITIHYRSKSGAFDYKDDYRILECKTEADALANAKFAPSEYYKSRSIVNGKFFAEFYEYEDPRDEASMQIAQCLEGILCAKPPSADEMLKLDIGDMQKQSTDDKVTLLIPASLFTTTTEANVKADAAALGAEVTKNEDGSYTYIMTLEQQQKTLENFKGQLLDAAIKIPIHEAYKNAIKSLEYNSDFFEIKFNVVRKEFEANDMANMAAGIVCLLAPNYQAFSGNPDPITKIQFIDISSGEIFQTASSPADFASDSNFVKQ